MRSSSRRALVAAAVVAWSAVPLAPAAAPPPDCPKGRICLWSERKFAGCFTDFDMPAVPSDVPREEPDYRPLRWRTCPDRGLNDDVSSLRNNSESYVLFYTGPSFTELKWCAAPGSEQGNLNEHFPGPADNSFSSHREGPDESGRTSEPGDGKYCNWSDRD